MGVIQQVLSENSDFRDERARWAALASRNAEADGKFWYAVTTTGVYCRPSCGARPAKPENVRFYDTMEAAEADGFRPCKRCRPRERSDRERQKQIVVEACRAMEAAETPLTLDQLAEAAGLSRYYFHRLFRSITGVTPSAYGRACRDQRLRAALPEAQSVTEAMYDAGYNSNGRFYANADRALGMAPSKRRAKGAGEQLRFAIAESSLGAVLVAASERGVCAITLGDDAGALVDAFQSEFENAALNPGDAEFEGWVARAIAMIENPSGGCDLPLDIQGAAFQERVWAALREIPPGETATYSDIAQQIGAPKAARAVANACASNRLAVAIPCHRIVRSDGSISGYRWGVERKRELLRREKAS